MNKPDVVRASFLVIQQKMIGDVLASTVICEGLKRLYPGCEITFVANSNTLPVLENNPFIDEVCALDRKTEKHPLHFARFLLLIRKKRHTAVIDAYGKLSSILISISARATFKIAYRKWYSAWAYSQKLSRITDGGVEMASAIRERLKLLEPLADLRDVPKLYPQLYLTSEEITNAGQALERSGLTSGTPLLMVAALGSSDLKTYPLDYLAQSLDRVLQLSPGLRLVFNYLPHQQQRIEELLHHCTPLTRERAVPAFYAKSLREYAATLMHCLGVLGNEGGAINIAKALSIPTFCLFSPLITKKAWHSEERQEQWGVHLRDYKAEAFKGKNLRQLRMENDSLYRLFRPELFDSELTQFCRKYLQK